VARRKTRLPYLDDKGWCGSEGCPRRRLLKSVGSGQRTRYFFNGLTEEIRNVPVVTQRDRQPTRRALGKDRWFHYDQVGPVIARTGGAWGSSAVQETIHQDAFGNTQASWSTGLWGGAREGWHHNAKDYDGDSGLVYMYQRWYSAETGTFMSSAPYPPSIEHRYGFAATAPGQHVDSDGRAACNNSSNGVWIKFGDTDNLWTYLPPGQYFPYDQDGIYYEGNIPPDNPPYWVPAKPYYKNRDGINLDIKDGEKGPEVHRDTFLMIPNILRYDGEGLKPRQFGIDHTDWGTPGTPPNETFLGPWPECPK